MENTTLNSYNLIIRISSDGFYLSVYNEANSLLTSKKINAPLFSLPLEEVIHLLEKETQLNYSSFRIICESDTYTIIPVDIFRIDEAADFLRLEHKQTKNESILFNKIPAWNLVNTFAIPGTIHNALNHLFPKTIIEHHVSYLLTDEVRLQNENCLYCHARTKFLDIITLKNGNLQLINSFRYQTPEDFTYFTLNVFDKLSLDIEKCPVYLLNVENKPELGKMLEKYVTVIS
jgi:hypothetical protein